MARRASSRQRGTAYHRRRGGKTELSTRFVIPSPGKGGRGCGKIRATTFLRLLTHADARELTLATSRARAGGVHADARRITLATSHACVRRRRRRRTPMLELTLAINDMRVPPAVSTPMLRVETLATSPRACDTKRTPMQS